MPLWVKVLQPPCPKDEEVAALPAGGVYLLRTIARITGAPVAYLSQGWGITSKSPETPYAASGKRVLRMAGGPDGGQL
jgi:hypothetical protein